MEMVLEITPDNVNAAKLLAEIYKSEDNFDKALCTLEEAYVFHRDDSSLAEEIRQVKKHISQKEYEESSRVFETPIESRKVNHIRLEEALTHGELNTETMFNLYLEQGEYDLAREIIDKIYSDEVQRKSAIEKLEKTKLNKINNSAGFDRTD